MLLQARAQSHTGAEQQDAQVVGRHIQKLTQGVRRHALDFAQNERLAVAGRQAFETVGQRATHIRLRRLAPRTHGLLTPRARGVELARKDLVDDIARLLAPRSNPGNASRTTASRIAGSRRRMPAVHSARSLTRRNVIGGGCN